MPSPLFNQLQPQAAPNNLLSQFMQFKRTFNGDPKQMVQQMINSGRVNQAQLNQYVQQANQLYEQLKSIR